MILVINMPNFIFILFIFLTFFSIRTIVTLDDSLWLVKILFSAQKKKEIKN